MDQEGHKHMRIAVLAILAAFVLLASASGHAQDRITANAVTDRTTLKGFVEGAKHYLESITTLSEIARLRDVFRAEGRWKEGPLFLTILTRNGNVIIHGDDPTSENKQIAAVRDEGGEPVVKELLDAAGRGGDFVDYRWDGAERTAYAVEYTSGLTGKKLVLTGGFSQDLSSVPVKIEPLPCPQVTAAAVVDRETLAIFVNAAAKAYRDAMLTPGMRDLGNTKNALRQEGGDWRSGASTGGSLISTAKAKSSTSNSSRKRKERKNRTQCRQSLRHTLLKREHAD